MWWSQCGRFLGSATTSHTASGGASMTSETSTTLMRRLGNGAAGPSLPPYDPAWPKPNERPVVFEGRGVGITPEKHPCHVGSPPRRKPIHRERGAHWRRPGLKMK